MSTRAASALLLALAAGAAAAADATLESAQRCAQLQDSLQRLVCYDRLFAPGQVAPAMPAPARPSAGSAGAPVVPPPAAPAPPASAAPTLPAAAPAPPAQPANEPLRFSAVVKALRETRPNVYRVELDNGQVWQQMEGDSTFFLDAGDTVEIDQARMGGFWMVRTAGKGGRSGRVRVNRVK